MLDVIALDEGEAITRALLLRRASHHHKCQMKFKPVHLEQAKKRSLDKGEMADEENEAGIKRFSHGITSNVGRCYFCEKQSKLFQNAENKQMVTTSGDKVLSSVEVLMENISPCNQEEVEYRVILHARHIASTGMKTGMVSISDTDVVVIAIDMSSQLLLDELWIEFGTGKHFRYIPIHQLAANLGEDKSKGLLFFHAFTGCDQVSAFAGIRKTTAWNTWENSPSITWENSPSITWENSHSITWENSPSITWENNPSITNTFAQLICQPDLIVIESSVSSLERFVCLMYSSITSTTDVNKCRGYLFVEKWRPLEALPPTKAALTQHILRVSVRSCMEPMPYHNTHIAISNCMGLV